jgi:hypothetical protein
MFVLNVDMDMGEAVICCGLEDDAQVAAILSYLSYVRLINDAVSIFGKGKGA